MRLPPSMRIAPVTVALVWAACIVCVGAYLDKDRLPGDERGNLDTARRAWGANTPRQIVVIPIDDSHAPTDSAAENVKSSKIPIEGLDGPFDIWDVQHPQPWRILVNVLHHGSLLHLLMNGWALIFLGRIIEPRMGRIRFVVFLLASAAVSRVASELIGSYSIGLSGVAYAMVGLLMVWRDHDEHVAQEFPISLVAFCGAWLLICQVLTYTDLWRIDNLGHYSGLIYGWLWGQAWLGGRDSLLFRFLFSVGHLAIVPAVWFLMHPFWNGTWYWYLAREQVPKSEAAVKSRIQLLQRIERLQSANLANPWLESEWNDLIPKIKPLKTISRRRIERLQTAVLRDPSLAGAWNDLSREIERLGWLKAISLPRPQISTQSPGAGWHRDAFRVAMQGLRHNRSNNTLRQRVIDQFIALPPDQAVAIVNDVCGAEAKDWLAMIHGQADPILNRDEWTGERLAGLFVEPQPAVPLAAISSIQDEVRKLDDDTPPENPTVDPDDPNSAALGELL